MKPVIGIRREVKKGIDEGFSSATLGILNDVPDKLKNGMIAGAEYFKAIHFVQRKIFSERYVL